MTTQFESLLKVNGPCDCPTCGRYAQVYKRRIHAAVAKQLIKMYNLAFDDYIHARELILDGLTGTSDLGKAKYFGLVIQKENHDDGLKSNGFWKLTTRGIDFVKNGLQIPEYVLVFDDKVIGISETTVNIEDCLSGKFNYRDLMNGE